MSSNCPNQDDSRPLTKDKMGSCQTKDLSFVGEPKDAFTLAFQDQRDRRIFKAVVVGAVISFLIYFCVIGSPGFVIVCLSLLKRCI